MTRVYRSLEEAVSEIQRDLSKAPEVKGSGVQGKLIEDSSTREIFGYSYTITDEELLTWSEAYDLGMKYEVIPFDDFGKWKDWITEELEDRLHFTMNSSEDQHPLLSKYLNSEGDPDYSYGDRLMGMLRVAERTLTLDPQTRRMYWPIFTPQDTHQIGRGQRIPCSLGYQFAVREIKKTEHESQTRRYLHMIYYQRSCDFERYWFSDVILARQLQLALQEKLINVRLGQFTHHLGSIHTFNDKEVY